MKTSAKKSTDLAIPEGCDTQTLPSLHILGVRRCGRVRWKAEFMLLRLKKNLSKNIFSSRRNFILKISKNIFSEILKIFQNPLAILRFSLQRGKENLKIPKGFWKFFKISEKIFFKIFKMRFLHEEKIFFDQHFFKPQEHNLSFSTRPTTPSNSKYVQT